jgi:putative flippase GtrA
MSSLNTRARAGLVDVTGQALRFGIVGIANTLVTGALFYVLAFPLPASVAYTIAFGLGICFAVFATPRFVFRVSPTGKRRVAYALCYVLVYVVGLGIVFLLDNVVRADRGPVVLLTIATTASLSFLGGRIVLGGGRTREAN